MGERYEEPPDSELYVRHMTVDEALLRLDEYLDKAFMGGLRQVRIVHGKGGGTLRLAIHRALGKHPLVRSYRTGVYGEGEEGVTVVVLDQR